MHIPVLSELRSAYSDERALWRAACDARDRHKRAAAEINDSTRDALSASEQRRFDAHMAALTDLNDYCDTTQRRMVGDALDRQMGNDSLRMGDGSRPFGATAPDIDAVRSNRQAVIDHTRRLLDDRTASRHLRDDQKVAIERAVETRNDDTDGADIARLIAVTERPAYRSAFMKYLAGDFAYEPAETHAIGEMRDAFRAMSLGTPSAGGLAVPALIDPTIIFTAQGSSNPILRKARVEQITNDVWRGISSAGMSWSFAAEGATVADNSPSIAQPEVETHKAHGFIKYSIEIGMDWPNFAAAMSETFSRGYDELLAEVFVTGTSGSNQPAGLLTVLEATTSVKVVVTTAGTLGKVDVYNLWAGLPERARMRPGCAWMSSTDVQNKVRALGSTVGDAFTVDFTADGIPRMFGREYPINDYFPDMVTGTAASSIATVGDFAHYLVAARAGMQVENLPLVVDTTTGRPTGQRGLYGWARVGAGVTDTGSFRLLTNKTS